MDLATGRGSTVSADGARSPSALLAELGRRAHERRFEVAPNPCVGAALVRAGEVLARGFHERFGGPHAEVEALQAARQAGHAPGREDTLVVTLEPCSTLGKQPACTDAILAAGIGHVVAGEVDPDARHRGRGLSLLRERGVDVQLLEGHARLPAVTPHFLRWIDPDRLRRPRPWTIAKWAQTRTGQLSPPPDVGDGRWISGPDALAEVQVLRGRVDAVLTGIGTVLADDPRLTVRAPGELARPPLRVVLDSGLSTPLGARLFDPAGPGEAAGELWIFCRPGAAPARHRDLERAGARVEFARLGEDGRLSLREIESRLFDLGVRRLLLEAGPKLLAGWFEADLVDQVRVYTGSVNGGCGPSLAEWLARGRLAEVAFTSVGADERLDAFVKG
jgi:diaminohydroxyphosphoribosylaminopyrimidine deaminase/5-amino-6-(5-phosphoribosylamino)uracil reductase